LHVNLRDPSGNYVAPGGGTTDEAAWTAGSSTFNPVGGAFNDSAAALTSGQQGTARATANRALHVNIRDHLGNEATLTGNSLNVNVTNASSGGTASADEAAFTAGSTQGTPAMAVFNDGLASVTSGQLGVLRMTASRSLHTTIDNASIAVTGTFWQATQPVSGTFWQATQPVSAVSLPLPTGAATAAKQPALGTAGAASSDVLTVQGIASMTALKVDGSAVTQPVSGTFWQATQPVSIAAAVTVQQATAANLNVTVGNASLAVTGTFWQATQPVSIASTLAVAGDVADAATDSGNPVKLGAVAYTTSRTSVTNGQRVNLNADHQGNLIVTPIKPREFIRTQVTAITVNTETTVITAGGAGVFNDIVSLAITNSSATTVTATLKDATAGTTRGQYVVPAGGGIVLNFPTPLAQQAAANNNWTITSSAAVSSLIVSAVYVISV
jgi:hypothetical protein